MRKFLSILLAALMLLAVAACAAENPAEEPTPAVTPSEPENNGPVDEEPTGGEEDGQNPVMNFIGVYGAYRISALVEAEGTENARITISGSASAFEHVSWTMSGRLDLDTLTVDYTDCVKTTSVFDEDGNETVTTDYENGTGRITFEGDTLTWQDDQENAGDGVVFTFGGGEAPVSTGDEFLGSWLYGRTTVEIARSDSGFLCSVSWADSAFALGRWVYDCQFDGVSLVADGTGVKRALTFGDEGQVLSDEVVYTDGSAAFLLTEDGKLLWSDYEEDAGSGMELELAPRFQDAPTPEDLVENYFHMIGGYEPGVSGSSISMALSACGAVRYALLNQIWNADVPTLRENLLTAWESMSQEEQEHFDANFLDVVRFLDETAEDFEANRGLYDDGGMGDTMESLLTDPMALLSWRVLMSNTLTMGNGDD